MRSPAQTAARYTLATLIVLIVFAIYTVVQNGKEHSARVASVAVEHKQNQETANKLVKVQTRLDQAIHDLQQAKIDSCHDLNKAIQQQIATEYGKDINVMKQLLPPPRTPAREAIADSFIAINVKTVKDSNPLHDCSAKSLGIISIPGASIGSSPKELLAGIMALGNLSQPIP